MDKLLSVVDAARALGGISPWTVRAYLSSGRLPRLEVGARTMIRESDLAKLVKECPAPPRGKRTSEDAK